MKHGKLVIAGAVVTAAVCSAASAQNLPEGRVYAFHSRATGSCPALDWHIAAEGNNALVGMISWDSMKSVAKAEGTVNPSAKTFQMTAKEVGGQGRTATINGSVGSNGWLTANIQGPGVNCQNINVPWYVPNPSG